MKRTSMPSTRARSAFGSSMLVGAMVKPVPVTLRPVTFCISVYERVAPVAVYSVMVPVTVTMSPILPTLPVVAGLKMNRPSDVLGSPSPFRSWIKKPLPTLAVMTPLVVATVLTTGLVGPEPWIAESSAPSQPRRE